MKALFFRFLNWFRSLFLDLVYRYVRKLDKKIKPVDPEPVKPEPVKPKQIIYRRSTKYERKPMKYTGRGGYPTK